MRLPLFAAFLLACLTSGPLAAETIKIGYVDLQRAVMEVEEGAEVNRKLKADFEKKQKISPAMDLLISILKLWIG